MEQKLDLRIQKTYLALTNAFLEMMEEMPFEEIRVSELCDRAMIRKSTFYKHFGDKYELLAFIVRQTQEKLNAQLAAERTGGDIVAYYTRLLTLVFSFLEENKTLVRSAVRSNSFPMLLSILSDQIILDIQDKLREDARRGEELPAAPEIMATFFVGGILETAFGWLKKGRSLEEASLREQLGTLLRQFYAGGAVHAGPDAGAASPEG